MKYLKSLLFVLFVSLFYIVDAQDFEVSPVKINFQVEPGESRSRIVTIKNHDSKNQTFLFNIQDFMLDKSGEMKYYPANSTKFSCAEWISISPSFFELKPNEETEITITMQVPVGDYSSRWGVIYVRNAKEQTSFTAEKVLSAGVSLSGQIAIIINQSPSSNTNYFATINRLSELPNQNDSIRKFSANIENQGDKIIRCKVYLVAADLTTAEETVFDPVNVLTYPKAAQTVVLDLPSVLPKGKYSLSAILDYGGDKALEGTQTIIEVK
jgi:hypothetical protein